MRMKNDTTHTDSAKQVRMKMWREKRNSKKKETQKEIL